MLIPKLSRRAALILGKTVGALVFAAVGGVVTWALDRERRRIQAEAERIADEPELVVDLPREVAPEAEPMPEEDPEPEAEPVTEAEAPVTEAEDEA